MWSANRIASADFNGDNNLDFVALNLENLAMYIGDGSGDFSLVALEGVEGYGWQMSPFAVADFNGDGKMDLVTGTIPYPSRDSWGINVYIGHGTGNFAPALRHLVDSRLLFEREMKAADINGDGKIDLVITGGDNSLSVLPGDGNGSFGPPTEFAVGMSHPLSFAFGDFNGDGKLDIATTGGNKLTVLLNTTYQTPIGANSSVIVNGTNFTFDEVTTGGTTTVTPIDPASVGEVPGGFAVSNSVAYEIATTATFIGSVTLAFKVPGPISEADFNNLAILHNENGTLVDVTASTPARDYANLTIYATTTSFSPFYLARRGNHIKSLFDQTKAYKSGSTIPIKLRLENASNANLSSANTSLVARDLKLINDNTTAPVVDSGNANPDYTFRYDATLGSEGGGYIFNLSTKGLRPGQYVLSFYTGSERSFFYTVKFEVR